MKKKYLLPLYVLLMAFMFPTTAFAGSINAAEQGIINVISATYEYDGAYYKVAAGYKAQVEEYLNRDEIDMSQETADSYISQFYANIGVGITSGYMEKIGDVNPPKQDTPSSGSTGNDSGNDKENNDEEDDKQDNKDSSGNSSNQNNENEQTESSLTQTEASATEASPEEITEQTIIKIEKPQTDSENTISVMDENGNPVDNTAGSTKSGKLEYTVVPMDEIMYVWGTETLNMHTEAYKDSEIIGSLVQGDKVRVIGAATTGWAQVEFDGQTGYVSATYLRTDGYLYNIGEDVELETAENVTGENTTEESPSEEDTKDYSDAGTLSNQIRLEVVAIGVIVILLAVCVVIVFIHKSKNKKI